MSDENKLAALKELAEAAALRLKALAETAAQKLKELAEKVLADNDARIQALALTNAEELQTLALTEAKKLQTLALSDAEGLKVLADTALDGIELKTIALTQAENLKDLAKEAAGRLKVLSEEVAIKLKARQLQSLLDNDMFRAIFDSIHDGIIVTNGTGKLLFNNKGALEISGLISIKSHDPVDFTKYFNFYKPDKETPWPPGQDPLSRALRGKTTIGELLYVKNNTGGTYISCMAVPLNYGTKPTVIGGVIIFRKLQQLTDTY